MKKNLISKILIFVCIFINTIMGKASSKNDKLDTCSAITPSIHKPDTCPTTTPFIHNESFWIAYKGQASVNCKFEHCFPKEWDAPVACDSRCLFTTVGHGLPEAVDQAFAGKKPAARGKKPSFVIAYGPPASGKSSILALLQRELPNEFKDPSETTVYVNVDSIFQDGEVGKSYKQYRETLIKNAGSPEKQELYTQRLYTYYRWTADQIASIILNEALAARYNIILWETTGRTTRPRKEIARINSYGFTTVVVYPLVEVNFLLERIQKRAELTKQESMPSSQIIRVANLAQTNLIDLLPTIFSQ